MQPFTIIGTPCDPVSAAFDLATPAINTSCRSLFGFQICEKSNKYRIITEDPSAEEERTAETQKPNTEKHYHSPREGDVTRRCVTAASRKLRNFSARRKRSRAFLLSISSDCVANREPVTPYFPSSVLYRTRVYF